jgi:hypothetical protein
MFRPAQSISTRKSCTSMKSAMLYLRFSGCGDIARSPSPIRLIATITNMRTGKSPGTTYQPGQKEHRVLAPSAISNPPMGSAAGSHHARKRQRRLGDGSLTPTSSVKDDDDLDLRQVGEDRLA